MISSVEMNTYFMFQYICIAAVQCSKALYAVLVKTIQYFSISLLAFINSA